MNILRPLAVVVPLVLAASSAHAKDARLTLHRPVAVGTVMNMTMSAWQSAKTEVTNKGRRLGGTERVEVRATVRATVKALSKTGKPIAFELRLDRLERRTSDRGPWSRSKATGKRVTVETHPRLSIKGADGRMLASEDQHSLSLLFPPGSADDDEHRLFGPRQPVRVGSRWTPRWSALASDLETSGLVSKPANWSGQMAVVRREKVAGRDCLVIEGTLALAKIESMADLKSVRGKASIRFAGTYPVDNKSPKLHGAMTFHFTARGPMKVAAGMTSDVDITQHLEWTVTSFQRPKRR